MKVLKFGGTSVGSAKNINNVIRILNSYHNGEQIVCVVSAVGGITDMLLLIIPFIVYSPCFFNSSLFSLFSLS